jgi:uncharacterized protein (TIGR03437 family)
MKLRRLFLTIALTALFCMPVYLISNESGPPVRRTGGPFPGEQSCASGDCHGGVANSGSGRVSITINGLPADQYRYVPGETVPVVVRVEDSTKARWGFELTARKQDGCSQAGSFSTSPAEGQVQILTTSAAAAGCPAGFLQFPMHLFPKATAGGADFGVNWNAPAGDIGAITFAAAGNAANGNRSRDGDSIYTANATVQPADSGGSVPAPSITSGGVVVATGTPLVSNASSNAILSIFGQDFAPDGTSVLNPQIEADGTVSTQLADTCVEINGTRSPLFAVLPTQINLQAPSNLGLGPASVVVIRGCGTSQESRGPAETVNVADVSPAFFNFVNQADGNNPIAGLAGGGPGLVGPQGLFGGTVQIAPAAPGDFVSLFGTGLGPTSPSFQAGQIPLVVNPGNPAAPVSSNVAVSIGGIALGPSDIAYVGVAPCCAGLYQVVLRVPENAPDGNLPLVVTVNGVSSPQGPFVAVQRP